MHELLLFLESKSTMEILRAQTLDTIFGGRFTLQSLIKYRIPVSLSPLSTQNRVPSSPPLRLLLAGNWTHSAVDTFHHKGSRKTLLDEFSSSLSGDGDWPFENLLDVLTILIDAGKATEALQVFHLWKSKEKSRATVVNYSDVIRLFCEKNLIDTAMLIFQDMEKFGVAPSLAIYNVLIHGFAQINEFHKSRALLTKMIDGGLSPVMKTYHGLIQAYGNHRLYDDMNKCVKMMESAGCHPNELTYNILIQEFSRAGLLEKMEKFYRVILSKKMRLQSSTLIAMVEAYADLGVLDKMEKMYYKVLYSNTILKDDLIRKVASVYIEHCRFGRLEELGNEIGGKTGRNELVWCILLLSSAGFLNRQGMDSISREIKFAKVRPSTTFTNIFALFYLKIKDFKALNGVFLDALNRRVEPDMLTVAIVFDACSIGCDCSYVLEKWKRCAYLEATAEMRTDPLVISAFGKGPFLLKCEKIYTSLGSKAANEKKIWKYTDLIRLVLSGQDDEDLQNLCGDR